MKKLLVVLALTVGVYGLAHSSPRAGQGWNVTITTGLNTIIVRPDTTNRPIFLKKIVLSSGTTSSTGDYVQAFSTVPSPGQNGAEAGPSGGVLFVATQAVTTAIVFQTTTTANNFNATGLSNEWSVGDCDECYLEISGDVTNPAAGLIIRQSAAPSGGANTATVYWKQ